MRYIIRFINLTTKTEKRQLPALKRRGSLKSLQKQFKAKPYADIH